MNLRANTAPGVLDVAELEAEFGGRWHIEPVTTRGVDGWYRASREPQRARNVLTPASLMRVTLLDYDRGIIPHI